MDAEIIIIGAGAAGLIAARELARSGKKVLILEARDRVGGRIFPLPEMDFGYPAQGGAEFVHGPALLTRALIKEAGFTYVSRDGEVWTVRSGKPEKFEEITEHQDIFKKKLDELKEDVSIAAFFDSHMSEEIYTTLREEVLRKVQAYDAADPQKVSAFMIRDEWFSDETWEMGRIAEGYGALVDFLKVQCEKGGVQICLGWHAESIETTENGVTVHGKNGEERTASKVVVTAPLAVLSSLRFVPPLPEKILLASKIGFGGVIKILLRFKDQWWLNSFGKDLGNMSHIRSREPFSVWWSQYPNPDPILTGWMAGPTTEKFKTSTDEELLDVGFISLENIFKVEKDFLKNQLVVSKIINWPADPYTKGAYSYTTYETKDAYEKLAEPVNNAIFFAGEALGVATATVEGALESGVRAADEVLKKH